MTFELEVVDVREQPYLVEYFRLMATPALVRVSETGNQVLAGDDIVSQIEYWWPRWHQELDRQAAESSTSIESPEPLSQASGDVASDSDQAPSERDISAQLSNILPAAVQKPHRSDQAALVGPVPKEPTSVINRSIDILRLSDEIFRLKQTQEELEAQLAFKDRIIAMMAHDLRNPLTAASIAIDTLEMGYNPDRPNNVSIRPQLTVQLLKNAKTQI